MSRVFTGSTSNILKYVGALGITQYPYTFAVWVLPDVGMSDESTFISYSNNTPASNRIQLRATGVNTAARMENTQQFNNAALTSTSFLSRGSWQAIVGTVESDSNVYIQIIGERAVSGGASGTYGGEVSPELFVGANSSLGGASAFTGKLAHIAIWSSALTTQQSGEILSGSDPSTIDPTNLLAYWPLTDASLTDTVGSKVLTVTGTVANDDADNPPVSGGPTTRPGIRIPDCYGPNADTFPADSAAVNYRMYDKQPDGTETLLGRGTDGAIASGAITIDNALAGSVDGTGWVDVFWTAGADTLSWSGPYTVIDLDA